MPSKQIQVFMTEADEQALSTAVAELGYSFVNDSDRNGDIWQTYNELSACTDWYVWIVDARDESLASTAWPAVQLLRSRTVDGIITAGRVAAAYEPSEIAKKSMAADVWSAIKGLSEQVDRVCPVTGDVLSAKERGYRTFAGAAVFADHKKGQYLRAKSMQVYFRRHQPNKAIQRTPLRAATDL